MEASQYILGAISLALALAIPVAAAAPPPQDAAVLAPVDALFAGMARRDAESIKAAALPGTVLILMREGKPEQMTIEAFADRVARPSQTHIEERIHQPLIRVDRDLAMVWAPFVFLIDGKPDHCGTDLFNLVHTGGKWLIAGIADTGTRECGSK